MAILIPLLVSLFMIVSIIPAYSAVFNISSGDVAGLIAAINAANANGEETTIILEPGTYTLTAVDNTTINDGSNGLPLVTSTITIQGAGADTTSIEREASAPFFRLVHVAESGSLTLDRLTLRGGVAFFFIDIIGDEKEGQGGGVLNRGTLTITNSILTDNSARGQRASGGAILNGGTATITNSTLAANFAQTNRGGSSGALVNGGTLTVARSALTGNFADGIVAFGGGINNDGILTVVNSTLAGNSAIGPVFGAAGGGINNSGFPRGILTVVNSTLAGNSVSSGGDIGNGGGGIYNEGTATLQNTILARNTVGDGPNDCLGPLTSLDHNLIGDPTGCAVILGPNDLTGDPGIGDFTDDGTPGNGHFPLLDTSPAIDSGDNKLCLSIPVLATDQLGEPRVGICDIGAIEFQPPVLIVAVDIRPGSPNNNIDPNGNALIPVAILSTNGFDATTVDRSSLRFGPNEAIPNGSGHLRDTDHDGLVDLVLQFRVEDSGIQCGDTSASITGQTVDGIPIQGTDTIRTVGCKPQTSKEQIVIRLPTRNRTTRPF
jgi:hypothetical protein